MVNHDYVDAADSDIDDDAYLNLDLSVIPLSVRGSFDVTSTGHGLNYW